MSRRASIEVASSTAINESIPMSNKEVPGSIRSGAMRRISATSARTISVRALANASPTSPSSRWRRSCVDSVPWAPRSPTTVRANSENFGACAAGRKRPSVAQSRSISPMFPTDEPSSVSSARSASSDLSAAPPMRPRSASSTRSLRAK